MLSRLFWQLFTLSLLFRRGAAVMMVHWATKINCLGLQLFSATNFVLILTVKIIKDTILQCVTESYQVRSLIAYFINCVPALRSPPPTPLSPAYSLLCITIPSPTIAMFTAPSPLHIINYCSHYPCGNITVVSSGLCWRLPHSSPYRCTVCLCCKTPKKHKGFTRAQPYCCLLFLINFSSTVVRFLSFILLWRRYFHLIFKLIFGSLHI